MIKTILFATALSVSTLAVAHPEKRSQRLIEALELDESRAAEVELAFEQFKDSARELREKHKEERLALKEKKRELLADILTEEEMQKLEEMFENRRSKFHDRDGWK